MGQKVNPHGLRVGVIKDWDSRWYASDEKVGDLIVEDQKIRKYLKKTLYGAGVPKIEIERSNEKVQVFVHCARPGMIVGTDKSKSQVEDIEAALAKMTGKTVKLSIVEVKRNEIDANAQLVARWTPSSSKAAQYPQRADYASASILGITSASSTPVSGRGQGRPRKNRGGVRVMAAYDIIIRPIITERAMSVPPTSTSSVANPAGKIEIKKAVERSSV
ncbi:30S ribosomal protein S3 [Dysosmobacter welbionis]|uniref:30S ribosomal protein S3 n=1 Tax=Dysosmobacter welbionis TaxID=2093857 RepID=UPI0031F6B03E